MNDPFAAIVKRAAETTPDRFDLSRAAGLNAASFR
jgi:hypothetical protein